MAEPTLDPAWLALVQADFDAARTAGISIIPRFAYLAGGDWPYTPPYGDAPLDIVLTHIEQLTPIFQDNADVISVVQAGFVGLWGEGYYTDHFAADPANPGVLTEEDWAKRRAVVEAEAGAGRVGPGPTPPVTPTTAPPLLTQHPTPRPPATMSALTTSPFPLTASSPTG